MAASVGEEDCFVYREPSKYASARKCLAVATGEKLPPHRRTTRIEATLFLIVCAEQFVLGRMCVKKFSSTALQLHVPAPRIKFAGVTILPAECRRVSLNRAPHLLKTITTALAASDLPDPASFANKARFVFTTPSDNALPRKWLGVAFGGSPLLTTGRYIVHEHENEHEYEELALGMSVRCSVVRS